MIPSRRSFLHTLGGLGAASVTASGLLLPDRLIAAPPSSTFRFAVIADSHVIDDFYNRQESNPLDTATVKLSRESLIRTRNAINALNPAPDMVFVVGDYFHDYPSEDYDFYFKNVTRIDHAKAITDRFNMKVYPGFGNHDYAAPRISRDFSHRLFQQKLGVKPYYAVDHKGVRFLMLSNFLGETWNAANKDSFKKGVGSYGEEQLQWVEAQLAARKQTFVFTHYPLSGVAPTEFKDFGLLPLLKKYKDTIHFVTAGHWHRWHDFKTEYGPQHYVMGATRYDADSYMVVDVDVKAAKWEIRNAHCFHWGTRDTDPYTASIVTPTLQTVAG
jgi:hypothetical protein